MKGIAVPEPSKYDYEAEEDARSMTKAAEIHGDRKRMAKAMAHMRKKMREMKRAHGFAKLQLSSSKSDAADLDD